MRAAHRDVGDHHRAVLAAAHGHAQAIDEVLLPRGRTFDRAELGGDQVPLEGTLDELGLLRGELVIEIIHRRSRLGRGRILRLLGLLLLEPSWRRLLRLPVARGRLDLRLLDLELGLRVLPHAFEPWGGGRWPHSRVKDLRRAFFLEVVVVDVLWDFAVGVEMAQDLGAIHVDGGVILLVLDDRDLVQIEHVRVFRLRRLFQTCWHVCRAGEVVGRCFIGGGRICNRRWRRESS